MMEQSCYNCIHLKVCKNWAEIAGHPESLDLNIGCTMFEPLTEASEIAQEIVNMLKSAGIDKYRHPIVNEIEKKYTKSEYTE